MESIAKNQQEIARIKPFINQYDWKELNFPSEVRLLHRTIRKK